VRIVCPVGNELLATLFLKLAAIGRAIKSRTDETLTPSTRDARISDARGECTTRQERNLNAMSWRVHGVIRVILFRRYTESDSIC
jgi:hypothetical protein